MTCTVRVFSGEVQAGNGGVVASSWRTSSSFAAIVGSDMPPTGTPTQESRVNGPAVTREMVGPSLQPSQFRGMIAALAVGQSWRGHPQDGTTLHPLISGSL